MSKRLAEYNTPIKNGMRVKHDALGRFIVKSGRKTLEDKLISSETIGGAFTTTSIIYNRASYSGGTSWWNPATGETIERPKIMVWFRKEDILTGDQECDCSRCLNQT